MRLFIATFRSHSLWWLCFKANVSNMGNYSSVWFHIQPSFNCRLACVGLIVINRRGELCNKNAWDIALQIQATKNAKKLVSYTKCQKKINISKLILYEKRQRSQYNVLCLLPRLRSQYNVLCLLPRLHMNWLGTWGVPLSNADRVRPKTQMTYIHNSQLLWVENVENVRSLMYAYVYSVYTQQALRLQQSINQFI